MIRLPPRSTPLYSSAASDVYKRQAKNISTLDKLIALNETVPEKIVKHCMLFVMKSGITPMWEDVQNRKGGCFSFKVANKMVHEVWTVSYTHLRAHETKANLVCRLLLEKKKKKRKKKKTKRKKKKKKKTIQQPIQIRQEQTTEM